MEKERRAIIVKEINYWKEHQLIPDQYCDFLLALYTEGEVDKDENVKNAPYYLLFYFFNTLLILFPLLLILATNNIWLQTIGILAMLSIAVSMIKIFATHPSLHVSYAIMIFLLYLLFAGILYINKYISVWWITYLWVLLNSMAWITFGVWKHHFFVKIGGVFTLIIIAIMYGFRIF